MMNVDDLMKDDSLWPSLLEQDAPDRLAAGAVRSLHRRRRRRRLVPAVVLVVVAAMGVGGTFLATAHDRRAPSSIHEAVSPSRVVQGSSQVTTAPGGAVPWRNIRAVLTPTSASVTPTEPPDCRPNALKQSLGKYGAIGGGMVAATVNFTNTSESSCYIDGLSARVTAAGVRVSFDGMQVGVRPGVLAPGAAAVLYLGTGNDCPQALTTRRLLTSVEVVLPGASTPTRISGLDSNAICGLHESGIGISDFTPVPVPPDRLVAITVSDSLPEPAIAGTVYSYTVTLTNNGHTPLALTPCPNYDETVYPIASGGVPHTYAYQLNCSSTPIPAGGHLTFDMQIAIPADALGQSKFSWDLETPSGRAVGGLLNISAP